MFLSNNTSHWEAAISRAIHKNVVKKQKVSRVHALRDHNNTLLRDLEGKVIYYVDFIL